MAKKDQQNEDVYQFPDQEDQVEYKPKGLVLDVVSDMVGSSSVSKYLTVRNIVWLVLGIVFILVIMNFRLILGWTHLGYQKAQGTTQANQKTLPKKAQPPVKKAVPQKKKVAPVSLTKTSQSSKEEALKLISQAPSPLPLVTKIPPPDLAQPAIRPPSLTAEQLLQQVQVLDKPVLPQKKMPVMMHARVAVATVENAQKTLLDSMQKLGGQIEAMQQQQTQVEDNLERLVRQLKEVQASVLGLKKFHKAPEKSDKKGAKKTSMTPEKTAKKSTPVKKVPHYRVQAMVFGRVWLQEKASKKVISLSIGDPVPGLKGRVKNIYLDDFFVETTQGERIYDHFE